MMLISWLVYEKYTIAAFLVPYICLTVITEMFSALNIILFNASG